jgi:NAD(P)H-dependent flavin oxidoreductase YrpB (nitropropane dioxygenase family)
MGPDLTGPELVAAVSNVGGLGILQAQFCSPLDRHRPAKASAGHRAVPR